MLATTRTRNYSRSQLLPLETACSHKLGACHVHVHCCASCSSRCITKMPRMDVRTRGRVVLREKGYSVAEIRTRRKLEGILVSYLVFTSFSRSMSNQEALLTGREHLALQIFSSLSTCTSLMRQWQKMMNSLQDGCKTCWNRDGLN